MYSYKQVLYTKSIGNVHAYSVHKLYNPANNTANQMQSVAGPHVNHSLVWLSIQQLQDTCTCTCTCNTLDNNTM